MPIARVEINGKIARIEVPEGTTPEQVEAFVSSQSTPGVVQAGQTLNAIPRQAGLGARAVGPVAAGAAMGAAMGAPFAGVGAIPGAMAGAGAMGLTQFIDKVSGMNNIDKIMDRMGLPKPQNATERVTQDVLGMAAGQSGLNSLGQVLSKSTGPILSRVGQSLAANPIQQTVGAASAGAAGGASREAGGSPLEQFGASVIGGVTGTGVAELGVRLIDSVKNSVKSLLNPKSSMSQINVTLNNILSENGLNVSQIPAAVRAELAHEVKIALDTGKQVRPDVVRRIADYAAVGATPTRGSVTLDPVQITQERNLAKLGANSNNPDLQALSQVQNTNNAKLIEGLNNAGANTANSDARSVGGRIISTIQSQDAKQKAVVDNAYSVSRDHLGRAAPMDAASFSQRANLALDEGMLGHYLPSETRSILNAISKGEIPLTVDSAVKIDQTLSAAQRSAGKGSPQALAIGKIRDALNSTGISDNIGEDAKRAFDAARGLAKNRFTWQESAPAIAAALDNPNPDRFVKDFILSSGNKSSTADVERLLFSVKKDPQAMQAVKENVAAYLKSKALNNAADEVGNFSPSGYNKALTELGDAKLRLFFNKDEIAQLKAIGRVASYEVAQPRGSAVNNSNTAGTIAGLLDKIASNPIISRVPFAGPAIQQPAQNWSAQIGGKTALDVKSAIAASQEKSGGVKLSDLLGTGFLLAQPRVNRRDDDK